MLPEHPRDHISEVLQEVEAVGNLHSMRSGSFGRFGVLSAMVPAHHFYSRMLRKPPGEGVRTPVGQNIHQRATLEIGITPKLRTVFSYATATSFIVASS